MTIKQRTDIPSDEPLETDQTEQATDSYIGECDATSCRFNRSHRCFAGTIQVGFMDGSARCNTYDPKEHTDRFDMNTAESI